MTDAAGESTLGLSNAPTPHNLKQRVLFVGRGEEVEGVQRALAGGSRATITTRASIYGFGGIGKTAIAREVAWRAVEAGTYPGGVFWLGIGAYVIHAGRDMGLGGLHEPGPGFAFYWVGILMCALAASIIGQTLLVGGPTLASLWDGTRWGKVLAVVVLLLVYGVVFSICFGNLRWWNTLRGFDRVQDPVLEEEPACA